MAVRDQCTNHHRIPRHRAEFDFLTIANNVDLLTPSFCAAIVFNVSGFTSVWAAKVFIKCCCCCCC